MKTLLQANRLLLVPENADEEAALTAWKARHCDIVFAQKPDAEGGAMLSSLGRRADACREPINVTSKSPEPIRLIANFAPTPFTLDGMHYACVEAFWQALRFPPEERNRIAALDGAAAKRESARCPYGATVTYEGRAVAVGTYEHRALMRRACRAKFQQNENARAALLATGNRPLVHVVRPDSRTIPGVIMAEIWMALRADLRRAAGRKSA
jgi:predicted NAD-dependent protein-ADP-ribosyltransferase YbiA (DUF1768 family)